MKDNNRILVSPFSAEAEKLASGEFLTIKRNTVKDRKHLSFTCDLDEMGDDAVIRIGHGYEVSSGCWLEITKKTVSGFSYISWTEPKKHVKIDNMPLDFELSKFLTVSVDRDWKAGGTFIVIMSAGGMMKIDGGGLNGDSGEIFASPLNCEIKNCKLNWFADGYGDPIWIFGDSYLGYTDPARWAYYLYRDGYSKLLLSGYSGMATERGLEDFKVAIEKGTPEFAFWCLGMNNGDNKETGAINSGWLTSTEEFLAICKEKGITPILSTIPSTPTVLNEPKNVWVRNWAKETGGRYVDFARAVGGHIFKEEIKDKKIHQGRSGEVTNKTGFEWYDGMLFHDLVHPERNGALALYSQVLVDFPEIMNRR